MACYLKDGIAYRLSLMERRSGRKRRKKRGRSLFPLSWGPGRNPLVGNAFLLWSNSVRHVIDPLLPAKITPILSGGFLVKFAEVADVFPS